MIFHSIAEQDLPFLLADIDHLLTEIDERQALDTGLLADVVVAQIASGAAAYLEYVPSTEPSEPFTHPSDAHKSF